MITFKEAREKVQSMEADLWLDKAGTFYVDTDGYGDGDAWYLNFGAEEWMVDGDLRFLIADADAALVDKKTGDVTITTYLDNAERYDAMRAVSVG